MKRAGALRCGLPLAAALLGASLVAGCNTYHYYDIDIKGASPVTETETSIMNFCQLTVMGAASDSTSFTMGVGCPPAGFPDIGTVEYSTFVNSGQLTFTFTGYLQNLDPADLCTTASIPLTASDEITQTGTIMVIQWNATNCPPHVTM